MRISPYFVWQAIRNTYRLLFFELARQNRFFEPLIPFRPVQAVMYLTERCNSKCITCCFWKRKSEGELTTAEIAHIMVQLRKLGVSYLCLTGGEPLLRHDLVDVVEAANKQRFSKIQLITNALLLTREVAENLFSGGLNKVTLSLNGIGKTHDMTRGVKGSYERCLEALRVLTELRDGRYHHVDLTVNMVVMKPNMNQILEVAKLCKQFGVSLGLTPIDDRSYYYAPPYGPPDVSGLTIEEPRELDQVIDELHKVARKYPMLINETHTSLEYLRNYFVDPIRKDIPCYLGYLSIYIGAHGEVFSGCEALPPIGNVREAPLSEIVNSREYRRRLAHMFAKECPGCVCGYGLNLYAHLPAILEEVLWRLRLRKPRTVSSPSACQRGWDNLAPLQQIHDSSPEGKQQ